MKKIKNIIVIFLALVLMVSFVGCKKEQEKPSMDLTQDDITVSPAIDEDLLVTGVNNYFANMPEHAYKIAQQEFIDKIVAGEELFVVDIRTAEDYAAGHIKGAFNLPWGTAISDNITKLPTDQEVFIYCYTGQTAGQAVVTMNLAGINARSINLGWNLGISKVEGYEAVTETTVNELPDINNEVAPEIVEALNTYYAGLAEVKETTYANYKISEEELAAIMEAEEDFYLLSVRKAEDFASAHIEGAENIPWGKGMELQFVTLPKDKKIVVYCYTGQTAGQTVAGLRLLGYDAVSLNGGMGMPANAPMGWMNKGFATVQ